jgi:hypothetical protein
VLIVKNPSAMSIFLPEKFRNFFLNFAVQRIIFSPIYSEYFIVEELTRSYDPIYRTLILK